MSLSTFVFRSLCWFLSVYLLEYNNLPSKLCYIYFRLDIHLEVFVFLRTVQIAVPIVRL